jgi:dipeptidyl aminopeptidase/acylaminoacyl peptidase
MARLSVTRATGTFRELYAGPTPSAVAPSPDGRWLAVVETRTDWRANAYVETLRLRARRGGGARVIKGLSGIRSLQWAASGDGLCFLARGAGGAGVALFRWDPRHARPMRLVSGGDNDNVTAYAFGPKGETYYLVAPPPPAAPAATVHFPRAVRMGELRRLGGGTSGKLPADALSLSVSADGRRLAYLAKPTPYEEDLFSGELYVMDLHTGRTRRAGKPRWAAEACAFSPADPDRLAVVARYVPGVYPSRADLYLIERGRLRNLSGRHDLMLEGPIEWSADGTRLRLRAHRRENLDILEFDLAGRVRTLAEGFFLSTGRTGDTVTHTIAGAPGAPNRVVELARPRPPREFGCRPQRMVTWRSDGRELRGVLATPRGRPPYPAVLFVHGGPLSPVNNTATRVEYVQPLAAAGLAVFVPAFRCTMGYGHDFIRAGVGDFCRGPWRDMERGLDSLIRAGTIDGRRLAVMGVSYGGYMSLFIPTRTRRFRAAVAINSIYDLASDAGATHRGPFAAVYLRKMAWDAPAEYLRNSPSGHIRKLMTPTLLLHGEVDTNTPLSNAREAAYALRNLRRDFRFKSYANEGHFIAKPLNRLDVLAEAVQWIDAHMDGKPSDR